MVVGGDFNLIRGAHEKINANINWPRVTMFNDSIAKMGLKEVHRFGTWFTWSNRQMNPVCSVLDRVLVEPEWEHRFPLSSLLTETIVASDQATLVQFVLETGMARLTKSPRFFFKSHWLAISGFSDILRVSWERMLQDPEGRWGV